MRSQACTRVHPRGPMTIPPSLPRRRAPPLCRLSRWTTGAGLPVAGEDPRARPTPCVPSRQSTPPLSSQAAGRLPTAMGALATEDRGWTLLLAPLTGFTSWAGVLQTLCPEPGLAAFPGGTCGGEEKGGPPRSSRLPAHEIRHLPAPASPAWLLSRLAAIQGQEASLSLRARSSPGPQAQPWTVMPGATLIHTHCLPGDPGAQALLWRKPYGPSMGPLRARGDVHESRAPGPLAPQAGEPGQRWALRLQSTPGLVQLSKQAKEGAGPELQPAAKPSWGRRVSMHLHTSLDSRYGATQGVSARLPQGAGQVPSWGLLSTPAVWPGSARPGWGACVPCRVHTPAPTLLHCN